MSTQNLVKLNRGLAATKRRIRKPGPVTVYTIKQGTYRDQATGQYKSAKALLAS